MQNVSKDASTHCMDGYDGDDTDACRSMRETLTLISVCCSHASCSGPTLVMSRFVVLLSNVLHPKM